MLTDFSGTKHFDKQFKMLCADIQRQNGDIYDIFR